MKVVYIPERKWCFLDMDVEDCCNMLHLRADALIERARITAMKSTKAQMRNEAERLRGMVADIRNHQASLDSKKEDNPE